MHSLYESFYGQKGRKWKFEIWVHPQNATTLAFTTDKNKETEKDFDTHIRVNSQTYMHTFYIRNILYLSELHVFILPPTPDPPPAISNCPKKPKSSHFLSKIYIFTEKGLAIHVLPVKKFLVWKSILAVHVPVSSTRYHRKGM